MTWTVLKTDGDLRGSQIERELLTSRGMNLIEIQARSAKDIIDSGVDADALLVLACPITKDVLNALPRLKIISRYGIGVDMVDVDYASHLGIPVAYVPDYCVDEVSTHTIALMLALVRKISALDRSVRSGQWDGIGVLGSVPRFADLTIGIIGFGRLGQAVARKLLSWNVTLLAFDPYADENIFSAHSVTRCASLEVLLNSSDIVTLHVGLSPDTFRLIDDQAIQAMKPGALLVNTSRGGLVHQKRLLEAIASGKLGGAALDVLEEEPPNVHELVNLGDRIIVTPHVAYYSTIALDTVQRETATAILDAYDNIMPRHLVRPAVWENRRR